MPLGQELMPPEQVEVELDVEANRMILSARANHFGSMMKMANEGLEFTYVATITWEPRAAEALQG